MSFAFTIVDHPAFFIAPDGVLAYGPADDLSIIGQDAANTLAELTNIGITESAQRRLEQLKLLNEL